MESASITGMSYDKLFHVPMHTFLRREARTCVEWQYYRMSVCLSSVCPPVTLGDCDHTYIENLTYSDRNFTD